MGNINRNRPATFAKGTEDIQDMIIRESERAGVDPKKMLTLAAIESNGRADAHNPSGATGLFQFMPMNFKSYGLENGKAYNPVLNTRAAIKMVQQNARYLEKNGFEPNVGNLYLAHQQGAGGAVKLLSGGSVGRQAAAQNGGVNGKELANLWTSKANATYSSLGGSGGGGGGSSGAAGGSGEPNFEEMLADYKPKDGEVIKSNKSIEPNFDEMLSDYKEPNTIESKAKSPENDAPNFNEMLADYKPVEEQGLPPTPLTDAAKFTGNSVTKAAAGFGDSILNAGVDIANLGMAGASILGNKAGLLKTDDMPEPIQHHDLIKKGMTNVGLISENEKYNPTTAEGRVADTVIQSIASGGTGAKNMLINGVSGAVGQGVQESTDSALAGLGANLLTGTVVKKGGNVISNTAKNIKESVEPHLPIVSDATAGKIAGKQILKEVNANSATPYTPETLADALTSNPQAKDTGNLLNQPTLHAISPSQHPIVSGLLDSGSKKAGSLIGSSVGGILGSVTGVGGILGSIAGKGIGEYADRAIGNKLQQLSDTKRLKIESAINEGLVDPEKLEGMLKTLKPNERISLLESIIPKNAAALPQVRQVTDEKK
jgi:hypothetical protein